jgi:hypothetical protein
MPKKGDVLIKNSLIEIEPDSKLEDIKGRLQLTLDSTAS